MKRLLPLLLCLALLLGCTPAPEETLPPQTLPPVTQAPETLPVETEAPAESALTRFPLENYGTEAVVAFGRDLLMFTTTDTTTLTRLSADDLRVLASVQLDCDIYSGNCSVQVSEKGVTYYDWYRGDLVFLDASLQEVSRIPMPEDMPDAPALTADRKTVYYLTDSALRCLDLESGIDRLVKEMSFYSQYISGLHMDDTLIECSVCDEYGNYCQLYLDADTGALRYECLDYQVLHTQGDRYFTTRMDGTFQELLTGLGDGDVKMIHAPEQDAQCFPVLETDGVVTAVTRDGATVLDFYRLSDGMRPYSITLPGNLIPCSIAPGPEDGTLWMLAYDGGADRDILCRWNLEASRICDDTVYIGIRRTAENPDEFGLAACTELAAELSEKHGAQILVWRDAMEVEPWDYTYEAEHHVSVVRNALEELDRALSAYPAGFLAEASSEMGDGQLRIHLLRGLYGVADSGALDSAGGIQFWDDEGNAHICLQIGEYLPQNLHHELFHVAESRIFSLSSAFDNWFDLNPEGFDYNYHYEDYDNRDDYHLLEEDTRAFIDFYSMTYPKEDRARIMEYATMEDCSYLFSSETMQKKLLALCTGIREAFGLEDYPEAFLWEQYLDTPIHKGA